MWTLEEGIRRRYVHGMTRLGVWYVRRLLDRGEIRSEDVRTALCTRVDLFRFTDIWDGASESDSGLANQEWLRLAEQVAAWVRDTPMREVASLEERVLRYLEPTLEARLPKDVGPPPTRPFGCWTYEPGWAGLADRPGLLGKLSNRTHMEAIVRSRLGLPQAPPRDVVLHIMNVMVPRSPFDDMLFLAGSLHRLISEVRDTYPQARALWCNTWLNEHPKFYELLPPVWFQNATVAPLGSFRNWWGQFARRDGDFNDTAAQQFREAGGVFRYRALLCHAGLDEIDEHLRKTYTLH